MTPPDDAEARTVIWRYLPFPRFESLVTLSALWFSKLANFHEQDPGEGLTPHPARNELKRQHEVMAAWFPDEERRSQLRSALEKNEDDGNELIVANCWFISNNESPQMWDEFGGADGTGVVIKSTIGALIKSLEMRQKEWWVGRVTYIDPATFTAMNAYEGNQAHRRAFLKHQRYAHEREFRVAARNFVMEGCLNPDGTPPTAHQLAGYCYSPDRPGLYVKASLATLIDQVRTSPSASIAHSASVARLLQAHGCVAPVVLSELTGK